MLHLNDSNDTDSFQPSYALQVSGKPCVSSFKPTHLGGIKLWHLRRQAPLYHPNVFPRGLGSSQPGCPPASDKNSIKYKLQCRGVLSIATTSVSKGWKVSDARSTIKAGALSDAHGKHWLHPQHVVGGGEGKGTAHSIPLTANKKLCFSTSSVSFLSLNE